MNNGTVNEVSIKKISNEVCEDITDFIIVEKLLNIFVDYEFYAALMCTPNEIEELAVGFLFSEGVISSLKSIESMEEKYDDRICVVLKDKFNKDQFSVKAQTSGCARGSIKLTFLEEDGFEKIDSDCKFHAKELLNVMKVFNTKSELFKQTGGVHSCAICSNKDIIFFSEDIGRHNALDKVVGKAVMTDTILEDKFLLTTGRISSEMIIKSAKAGIPIIVSHSAPSDLALRIAKAANITLIGFARGSRMNVYSGAHRIL
jgi:FdhD protein